jgi:tRNA A-37 threonylcarbamoyl transferase component Bud32
MKHIKGDALGKLWDTLKPSRKRAFATNERLLPRLRAIPHPRPSTVCSVDLFYLCVSRIIGDSLGFGSLKKDKNLIFSVTTCLMRRLEADFRKKLGTLVKMHAGDSHGACFTHGDPSRSNIMVKTGWEGNIKAVGLIDFETEGFLLIRRDHKAMLEKT